MKRAVFRYLKLIAVTVIVLLVGLVFYPVYQRALDGQFQKHHSCRFNLEQIGLAVMQYSQDYDERMPIIAVNAVAESVSPFAKPYGWADALYPYCKSTLVFPCPQEPTLKYGAQDAVASQFTDYYYNSNLNGIELKLILDPATTILSGDGNDGMDGSDARYNRNVIPKAWLNDENSPARRHENGANYAFVDGHVKWLKAESVKAIRTNKSDYSFAVN